MPTELGVDAPTLLTVAAVTVGVCLLLVLLIRVSGQRNLVPTSALDTACLIGVGAVAGRTVLPVEPTPAAGAVALVVFFALQRIGRGILRRRPVPAVLSLRPVVLVRDGEWNREACRRSGVTEDDLRQRLRQAGVAHRGEVRCAVLERNGSISVIRGPHEMEPWLAEDLLPPARERARGHPRAGRARRWPGTSGSAAETPG